LSILSEALTLRLPKPIYELMPFFLIGVGVFFIALVLNRYEHAPTLVAWFAGIICIVGGTVVLVTRVVTRSRRRRGD
jgi:heme/copper-type cytochrome/quinol oxidase subunit 1